jgi:uracil-DNA glycosylase family 4
MLQKPKDCDGCPLNYHFNGFSIPEGTGRNKVWIVGEALGEKEKWSGTPFVRDAESGSVLETAIRKAGFKREDFVLYNMIQCQPLGNKLAGTSYEYESIEHCKVHRDRVFNKFKPNVILACGATAFKHLTGTFGGIGGIEINRGYVFDSIYPNTKLVATLHPSFIRRKLNKHIGVLTRDIKRAVQVANGQIQELDTEHYNLISDHLDIVDFIEYCKKNPSEPISYDIETEWSKLEADDIETNQDVRDITQIQFQVGKYSTLVFNWETKDGVKDNSVTDTIIEILKLPNPKIGWNNYLFDKINLEYHLGKVHNGTNLDLMWAWHHWQPDVKWPGMKLQFVTNIYEPNFPAWKHLADSEPLQYGCYDVDAVYRIYNGLIKDLKHPNYRHKNLYTGLTSVNSKSLYEGYIDDVVKLWPILVNMSDRGLPIDLKAREEFKQEIKAQILLTNKEIQDLYPFHLRKTEHKEGYKYVPKEVQIYTERFNKFVSLDTIRNGLGNDNRYIVILDDNKKDELLAEYIEENTRKPEDKEKKKPEMTGLVLREFVLDDGNKVYRYDRIEVFKPNSSQQLVKYIKWKNHKVPTKRNKEGELKPTTSKEHIYNLWIQTGDPLYEGIIRMRELNKMLGTYIGEGDYNEFDDTDIDLDSLESINKKKETGWPIGKDGRVHTTYVPEPATGQLSSKNPNVQNPPARGNQFSSKGYKTLADKFRRTIAATSNKLIMEFDYTGFHALMLGFESECETYMRLSRLGIHDYVAAWMIKPKIKIQTNKEHYEYLLDLDKWLSYDDNILSKKLSWVKNNYKMVRNSQAKPAVHGIGFGEGVNKLYQLNRHSFNSVKEVQVLHDLLKSLFPEIFDYQVKIRELASKQSYLVSRFGYIRRFYDVYDYRIIKEPRNPKWGETIFQDKDGKWWSKKPGLDSESCIAYLPSNNAFGLKKEKMRLIHDYDLDNKYGLINDVHDSLMFECPNEFVDEAAIEIPKIMGSPTKHLINNLTGSDGLWCGVEVKVGKNWAEMKDYKI